MRHRYFSGFILVLAVGFLALSTGCRHIPIDSRAGTAGGQTSPPAAGHIDLSDSGEPSGSDENAAVLLSSETAQPDPDAAEVQETGPVKDDTTSPETETAEPTDVPPPATPDPEADAGVVQESTDQALELCRSAQEMWEKGRLEEALSSLDTAYQTILDIDIERFPDFSQQKEDLRFLIAKRILEIYSSRQIVVNGQHNEIPMTENSHVKAEIQRLTGPERQFFIQSLERSGRYRPYIVSQLKKAGLPEELSWLPLIESGYKVRALSSARALGLWQFIPSTGYKFGLNRNYYIDERLDFEKSTLAAISYLKELHNLFGDWTTVLAAYNCGEGRVLQKIRQQKLNYLDNFWDLYERLPRETARYVPRFLATLHIVNNLSDYGITVPNPLKPIPFKTCRIQKQIRLKDIAREIGSDPETLRELNPELRYAILPPDPYELRIPADKTDLFLSRLDKIETTYTPPARFVYHRVRRGETLSGLAMKYRTTVRAISAVNRIDRHHTIIAGKVLKIPVKDQSGASDSQRVTLEPGQKTTYTVRQGDNLWIIARRFNTTTKHIMAVNNLTGTFLHVGQKLVISSNRDTADASGKTGTVYRVKKGDSPFSIAKKHNMSLHRLMALNRLTKRSKIFPGQTLYVE